MKGIKVTRAILPIVLLLTPVCTLAGDGAESISPSVLHERRLAGRAPLVIDVRTLAEFNTGHVPGAVNIPHMELSDRIDEARSEHGVALYCGVGPRARIGEKTLLDAGFSKVFHLEGGLVAWRESGLPIETPDEHDD